MKDLAYTIVVCYDFSKDWLAKSRADRKSFESRHIAPIFGRYGASIRRRAYDAESFTTEFSDFMMIETADLPAYYFFIEELRACALFTQGYASIKKIFMGIEDGYHVFEAATAQGEPHAASAG